jgi:hypothetical protein
VVRSGAPPRLPPAEPDRGHRRPPSPPSPPILSSIRPVVILPQGIRPVAVSRHCVFYKRRSCLSWAGVLPHHLYWRFCLFSLALWLGLVLFILLMVRPLGLRSWGDGCLGSPGLGAEGLRKLRELGSSGRGVFGGCRCSGPSEVWEVRRVGGFGGGVLLGVLVSREQEG